MENQDKLFKDAANKAEDTGFARLDAVWDRVEEKLDHKKQRRIAAWWKYSGIAATLLLSMGIGFFMLNNDRSTIKAPKITPENKVTVIDTQRVKETLNPAKHSREKEVVSDEKAMPLHHKNNDIYNRESLNATDSANASAIEKVATTTKSRKVTGVITDSQGTPIPGVDVIVAGTRQGTQTDFDGKYMIDVKEGEKLIASFIGMQTQTVTLGNRKDNINLKLADDINALDEVVVESYRTTVRATSNAAVTIARSKSSEEINNQSLINREKPLATAIIGQPNSNFVRNLEGHFPGPKAKTIQEKTSAKFIQKLQGPTPGLSITTASGKPGSNTSITNLPVPNALPVASFPNQYDTLSNGKLVKRALPGAEKQSEQIETDHEEYESFAENQFENPYTTPLSTFSIDVDNASYTNVRRFLNNGQTVPKDAVRVEEMINFFKYQYPQPINNEPFSINTEYSDAPWNSQHKLLRIGLQGKIIADDNLPASNFVFLIDVSGSMNEQNKLPLLKESMKLLVNQMRKKDRIAIVVYAGAAGLVLPSTSGDEKEKIITALENLSAGGSTAGGAGIELAYKTASENFIKNGNNRVILATDGDFNIGASSDSDMQTLIEDKRKTGVLLTCLGYGMGNYKDAKMEILADKGNGNYAYIDSMQEADRYLTKEFKGSMYAIAKDVKIQIEFNPKHVQSYRLIGYENRKLHDEDFANDAVDAGEMGSGHTVTALYEIIPAGVKSDYLTSTPDLKYSKPAGPASQYNDELATIKFRSKKPHEDKSTEVVKVIPDKPLPLQSTSGDFKFSAAVAWFGLKLRDSKLVPNKKTDDIKALAKQGLQNDPEGYRAEFIRLVDMVK